MKNTIPDFELFMSELTQDVVEDDYVSSDLYDQWRGWQREYDDDDEDDDEDDGEDTENEDNEDDYYVKENEQPRGRD